ncbi:MAG: hypothetical protein ACLSHC_10235 [Bilophila wadsworthia]
MNTPIIEVRNLSKTFVLTSRAGWRSRPFPGSAFPWTRRVRRPHGPSGAGKSTLLRALHKSSHGRFIGSAAAGRMNNTSAALDRHPAAAGLHQLCQPVPAGYPPREHAGSGRGAAA